MKATYYAICWSRSCLHRKKRSADTLVGEVKSVVLEIKWVGTSRKTIRIKTLSFSASQAAIGRIKIWNFTFENCLQEKLVNDHRGEEIQSIALGKSRFNITKHHQTYAKLLAISAHQVFVERTKTKDTKIDSTCTKTNLLRLWWKNASRYSKNISLTIRESYVNQDFVNLGQRSFNFESRNADYLLHALLHVYISQLRRWLTSLKGKWPNVNKVSNHRIRTFLEKMYNRTRSQSQSATAVVYAPKNAARMLEGNQSTNLHFGIQKFCEEKTMPILITRQNAEQNSIPFGFNQAYHRLVQVSLEPEVHLPNR